MSRLVPSVRERFRRRIADGGASLRLYAILDAESCARRGLAVVDVAMAWRDAGVALLQYRDKLGSDAEVLQAAAAIGNVFRGSDAVLILNDRVHLLAETGWHGVHVGQTDAGIAEARAVLGADAILGVSTHTPAQVALADVQDVDYVAVGPVFGTTTKLDAEPMIGLEGVRVARGRTRKPLVAIGGIARQAVPQVLEAGADSIAVISALLPGTGNGSSLMESARDFLAAFK